MNLPVICIDDTFKPAEIPDTHWVKVGNTYHITQIDNMRTQGIVGCKLAEINNDDKFPYTHFRLSRFAVTKEDFEKEFGSLKQPIEEDQLIISN